jgi:hypothetical protein
VRGLRPLTAPGSHALHSAGLAPPSCHPNGLGRPVCATSPEVVIACAACTDGARRLGLGGHGPRRGRFLVSPVTAIR